MRPKTEFMKERNDKLDFIRIKNICPIKDTIKRIKTEVKDWEKTLVNHISDKEFVSRIYKDTQKSTVRK